MDYLSLLPEKPEKALKKLVRESFAGCCIYCGDPQRFLTCDHITPVCRGGKTSWDNLAPACVQCNTRKADKDVWAWWEAQPFYCGKRAVWLLDRVMGRDKVA